MKSIRLKSTQTFWHVIEIEIKITVTPAAKFILGVKDCSQSISERKTCNLNSIEQFIKIIGTKFRIKKKVILFLCDL